jgi:hypothetical protein
MARFRSPTPKMLSGGKPSVLIAQAGAPSWPPPGVRNGGYDGSFGKGWINNLVLEKIEKGREVRYR